MSDRKQNDVIAVWLCGLQFPCFPGAEFPIPFNRFNWRTVTKQKVFDQSHPKAIQSNSTTDTYHSSEGWRDQSAVDGNKTAADQRLWAEPIVNL